MKTSTSSALLNAYIKQDYLDNSLRGGVPLILGDPENPKVLHTFNRVHGDIERDYNWFNVSALVVNSHPGIMFLSIVHHSFSHRSFLLLLLSIRNSSFPSFCLSVPPPQLEPTFFSQGPGNFRDVNQNRRNDVMIHPTVGDFNIRMFLSFVQADGYNPLQVATTNFKVPADRVDALVLELGIIESYDESAGGRVGSMAENMKKLLLKPFRIGQLFKDMKTADISFKTERNDFLTKVMVAAEQASAAAYMQNGYWCDVSIFCCICDALCGTVYLLLCVCCADNCYEG